MELGKTHRLPIRVFLPHALQPSHDGARESAGRDSRSAVAFREIHSSMARYRTVGCYSPLPVEWTGDSLSGWERQRRHDAGLCRESLPGGHGITRDAPLVAHGLQAPGLSAAAFLFARLRALRAVLYAIRLRIRQGVSHSVHFPVVRPAGGTAGRILPHGAAVEFHGLFDALHHFFGTG